MRRMKEPLPDSLSILGDTGFDSYECLLREYTRREISLEQGKLDLLSTLEESHLTLKGISDGSQTSTRLSRCIEGEVRDAASRMKKTADSAPADPAFEIAPFQEAPLREKGPDKCDVSGMIDRLMELKEYSSLKYPDLSLRRATLQFQKTRETYANSNGTKLSAGLGAYLMTMIFSSLRGSSRSSFNYVTVSFSDLKLPLHERGEIDSLLEQSVRQLSPELISGGFTGDVIVSPHCLGYFLFLLTEQLQDGPIIKGTSLYQDSLGKRVADERLNFSITPVGSEFAQGSFICADGFPAQNVDVISNGVLKSHLLSLYGANKTGFCRAGFHGGYYAVRPGSSSLNEIISGIDRGLLVTRFSGGWPGENGDFSGIAKNSFYIEKGQVKHPVSEVMIRLNLKEMFNSIKNISKERVNQGASLLPWIQFSDVPIQ